MIDIHRAAIWTVSILALLGPLSFLDAWLLGALSALLMGFPATVWLHQPLWTVAQILTPSTAEATEVAGMWWSLQPLVVVLLLASVWQTWRPGSGSGPAEASHYGSHGTARWATTVERRQVLRDHGPGLLLGKADGRLWRLHVGPEDPLNDFVILFGPSKSGKSSRYVIPNMLHETEASVITSDPKGELYRMSASVMAARGYQVAVLNLKDTAHSMRYNPLAYCDGPEDVFRLAHTLVHNTGGSGSADPFWEEAEQAYLSALVLYVLTHQPPELKHMASVLQMATTVARAAEQLDAVFDTLPPGDSALQAYNIFRLAADAGKMRAGIVTGAAVRLRLWAVPALAEATAANDFDLRELGRRRTILYLILRDDTSAYAPLTSLLFAQVIQELYREADCHGGRLPVPVRLRLDEAANIGAIPEFAAKIATMRSRGMSPEIIIQDLGQLQRLYPNSWSTILANCDVQLLFGANDQLTARYISDKLGTKTIRTASVGQSQSDRSAGVSESQSYTGRPLLMPDEIMSLPRDEVLLFLRGQRPLRLHKAPFDELMDSAQIEQRDPAAFSPPTRRPLTVTGPSTLPTPAPKAQAVPKRDALSFMDKGK